MVTRVLGLEARAPEWVEAVATFVVALALAALSWRLIEQPLMRLKDRPPRLPLAFLRLTAQRAPEAG